MEEKKEKYAEGVMKVLKVIGMVILGVAAAFLFGLVIMLLWNWLMPHIFSLPEITYWEGIGLLILSCILFGRVGGGSSDEKKKDKGKDSIRGTIKEEIKKEIAKEFEKEFKKCGNEENAEYESMYEKWWEAEGKDCFEKYSKRGDEEK
jgi:hypothetical protein